MPDKHADNKNTDDASQSKPDTQAEAKAYLQEQEEGVKFLRKKFSDLHNSPEATSAVKRTEAKTKEKVPQKPEARIANYLHRFREILDRKDEGKRQRGIEALKRIMHRQNVIKPKDIPESAFLLEQRIARELGHGDVEITDEFRERKTREVINNQTRSLDRWLDYLAGADVDYPDWARYWAFSSMLKMGKFQKKEEKSEDGEESELKETARYLKRRKDTAAAFPMLNSRALAGTIAAIKEKKNTSKNKSKKLSDNEYQKLIATEDFSKIYTQFLIEMPEYSVEGLQETKGRWVIYAQGSNADPLVSSLEGYPLEWCTAEFETAQGQLEGGDFHVYYSLNEDGEALIPRLAIRMEHDSIAEVRGIAPDQNIDPYIAPELEKRLKNFGSEGKVYQKKASDMKRLTEVEKKNKAGEDLSSGELRFLYATDDKIQGFGYNDDPRIGEIKEDRNIKKDYAAIYDVREDQAIDDLRDLTMETGVYTGEETYTAPSDISFEQIEALSKVHNLTVDLTNIRPEVKEVLTRWQGNLVDNSYIVAYPNLATLNGYFDANNATTFETGLTFPLEERLNSKPKHYKKPDGIDNEKVKAALEANPEAMTSLLRMELSGGAPDVIAETDNAYIFADCSAESPLRRRNLDFDQSAQMAERFGIELVDEDTYRKIQETGQFDLNSWIWLKTPADVRDSGCAIRGIRDGGKVYVDRLYAGSRGEYDGWRGLLRVPKA